MAKWGEGDPRWIVEERPDAVNVNNWHWTEKNATPWSKERFNQLFNNFKIEQSDMMCEIESVESCKGEATVNNRKGKLIYFYEWELEFKWKGQMVKNSGIAHKGKVKIPNLSEENDLDEIEITIYVDESNNESEALKQFMYNIGREKIRSQLGLYIKELKEEYSKNLILPKKGEVVGAHVPSKQKESDGKESKRDADVIKAVRSDCGSIPCKLDVRTLTMSEQFQCSANDLYNALTRTELVTAFSRVPSKIDPVRGGEFMLYSGNVTGKFEELIPEKRIVMSWRLKHWSSAHYSNVTIDFEETSHGTMMSLTQTGIPAAEFDSMRTNWHRYYWHSIRQTFGFGADIMDAL